MHSSQCRPRYTSVRVNTLKLTRESLQQKLEQELTEFNTQLRASLRTPISISPHAVLHDVLVLTSSPPTSSSCDDLTYNPKLKSIIVDRKCGEAVLRGADIFACGVMCASSGASTGDVVNIFIDLDHVTTRAFPIEQHRGRKIYIGMGKMMQNRKAVFHTMTSGLATVMTARVVIGDAPPLNGRLPSQMFGQNLPSSVVAHVLNPKAGDVVLDMCAAPGGKTSHIATLMSNEGLVVACDRSETKIRHMISTYVHEWKLRCVVPCHVDSRKIVLDRSVWTKLLTHDERRVECQIQTQRLEQKEWMLLDHGRVPKEAKRKMTRCPGFVPETFDKILLDPPCSALGLRPRLVHVDTTPKLLDHFAQMQRDLVWSAMMLLKVGGTLVYSTCTINPQENEQFVAHVLKTYPCLVLCPQPDHLMLGEPGLANQGLTREEAQLVQRFDPSSLALDTMGFFIAKFKKVSSSIQQEKDEELDDPISRP